MQLIGAHAGKLITLNALQSPGDGEGAGFTTGLTELDALLPGQAFARGAIHELLGDPAQGLPSFFGMLIARSACQPADALGGSVAGSSLIWCDPDRTLYPPALAAWGVPLDRLYLLRTQNEKDLIWAVAECLSCRGVGAVVAAVPRLSRVAARRLQLAAERGGGVGLLLRPARSRGRPPTIMAPDVYAAATRWFVQPAPGEARQQRWNVRLLHGHGGRIDQSVILERSRESHQIQVHSLPAAAQLAHRPGAPHTPAAARIANAS